MKNYLPFALLLFCFACNNSNQSKTEADKEAPVSFFPTNSFFMGQLKMVDSLQLPVLKYNTVGSHKDTNLISTKEMADIAKDFTEIDLSKPETNKAYKEESFADQSISAVTLTYATTNKELPVQRMDVLINPDPVMNDKVRSIYIEKLDHINDTTILKKMFWKTDRHFLIITTKTIDGKTFDSQLRVQWGG